MRVLGPPQTPATAQGLISTRLPCPAIPGGPAADPGHVWHSQPARHSRHHRCHRGCRDRVLRHHRCVWNKRVSMEEGQGSLSSLLTVSTPSLPQTEPLSMGLSPQPLSLLMSLKDHLICPVHTGRLRALVPAHICGPQQGVSWSLCAALICPQSPPQACPCLWL